MPAISREAVFALDDVCDQSFLELRLRCQVSGHTVLSSHILSLNNQFETAFCSRRLTRLRAERRFFLSAIIVMLVTGRNRWCWKRALARSMFAALDLAVDRGAYMAGRMAGLFIHLSLRADDVTLSADHFEYLRWLLKSQLSRGSMSVSKGTQFAARVMIVFKTAPPSQKFRYRLANCVLFPSFHSDRLLWDNGQSHEATE
jgi:hypothetical protein